MRNVISSWLVWVLASGCVAQEGTAERASSAIRGQNALTMNALTMNALTMNALTMNALTMNALTMNGQVLSIDDPAHPFNVLDTDALSRDFFRYAYSCAMPAGASITLDLPNAGSFTAAGAIGLAPDWGQEGGSCDEICQRWVSACLLARTNHWGIPVDISLRGPHPALAADPAERAEFTMREGSFYGNLFASSPALHACSGPASGLAALTARFCSAANDGCILETVADCTVPVCDRGYPTAIACDEFDDAGVYAARCYSSGYACDSSPSASATAYTEVITVYLREPAIVCGNAICQEGETIASCPSDCLPGFASRFGNALGESPSAGLAEHAGILYTAGTFSGTVDFGGVSLTSSGASADLFVAAYSTDGALQWARSFATERSVPKAIAVDARGIVIAGELAGPSSFGGATLSPSGTSDAFVAAYDLAGSPLWSIAFGSSSSNTESAWAVTLTQGGAAVASTAWGDVTLSASSGSIKLRRIGDVDVLVALFERDRGRALWAKLLGGRNADEPRALATDGADVFLGGRFVGSAKFGGGLLSSSTVTGFVARLRGTDGSHVWSMAMGADTVDVTHLSCSQGRLAAAGRATGPVDPQVGSPKVYATVLDAQTAARYGRAQLSGWSQLPDSVGGLVLRGEDLYLAANISDRTDLGGSDGIQYPMQAYLRRFDRIFTASGEVAPGGKSWMEMFGGPVDDLVSGLVVTEGRVAVVGSFRGTGNYLRRYLVNAGGNGKSATTDMFLVGFPNP